MAGKVGALPEDFSKDGLNFGQQTFADQRALPEPLTPVTPRIFPSGKLDGDLFEIVHGGAARRSQPFGWLFPGI